MIVRVARVAGLLLAAFAASRQGNAQPPPVRVPFEMRGDNIVVAASVNGVRAMLVLDTGSGIAVFDPAFAAAARLDTLDSSIRVIGTRSSDVIVQRARAVTLGGAMADGATLNDMPVAAIDLGPVQARLGADVVGTIGYELFQRYVTTIDFATRIVELASPAGFAYSGRGLVVPVVTTSRVPVATVDLVTRTRGTVPARLVLDLGSSGYAIKLARGIVDRHALGRDTTTVHAVLGVGVGGVVEGDMMRLPAMRMGDVVLVRPSVALSRDSIGNMGRDAPHDGVLGLPVFRRTRTIIDYARGRVIFEPVARLDIADTVDASGLSIADVAEGGRTLTRVMFVVAGSAGAIAGVRAGDEITAIDGRPVGTLSQAVRRELFRRDGMACAVTLRRDGAERTVTLRLRQII